LIACGDDQAGSVELAGHRFSPDVITIEVGETVTWTSASEELHTVTAVQEDMPEGADYFASGGFSSEEEARAELSEGLLENKEHFEVVFDTPGTYQYVCIPHESDGMRGRVIVEAKS
jgi:plastocyanin